MTLPIVLTKYVSEAVSGERVCSGSQFRRVQSIMVGKTWGWGSLTTKALGRYSRGPVS